MAIPKTECGTNSTWDLQNNPDFPVCVTVDYSSAIEALILHKFFCLYFRPFLKYVVKKKCHDHIQSVGATWPVHIYKVDWR